jgi:hypothetical protein
MIVARIRGIKDVRAWLLIGLLALGGCKPGVVQRAEAAVRLQLKDPDSAKFSEIEQCGDAEAATGKVNARNGFGGYTGPREFAYANGEAAIAEGGDVGTQGMLSYLRIDQLCLDSKDAKSKKVEMNLSPPAKPAG